MCQKCQGTNHSISVQGLEQFAFEIPKQLHSRILNVFLVRDFSSNDFSEISLILFIIAIKADTRNFSQKYPQIFLLDAIFFEQ